MPVLGFDKQSLLELDPEIRAFTLVGAFMGHFALLESGINAAIGDVLDIRGLKATIVTRNMGFNDKIFTLRTLVNTFLFDKKLAKAFDQAARQAKASSEWRNIIAHTAFRSSETTDGVEFFQIKASGELKFPDLDWSIDRFIEEIDVIDSTDRKLRAIEMQMPMQRIAEALMNSPGEGQATLPPTLGGLFGLASFRESDSE